jgi:membrane-bound serine protease (ClpP class)
VVIAALGRILPATPLYGRLVSQTTSGTESVAEALDRQEKLVGQVGVAVSVLRPGGKAQFGDLLVDVVSEGEMIEKGTRVRVIRHSSTEAVVAPVAAETE